MRHKTYSNALAALLHCSGNFTYVGREGNKFLFDGPDDSVDFDAFAAVLKYFSVEQMRNRASRNRVKAQSHGQSA
jgi:hypothetical protein